MDLHRRSSFRPLVKYDLGRSLPAVLARLNCVSTLNV
jgi:hypothetical protein